MLLSTRPDPEWDDYERALVDAYLDWQADIHPGCGHPLTDSLLVSGTQPPTYRAGFQVCAACLALDRDQRAQDKRDEPVEKNGGHVAHGARLWQVIRADDP